MPNVVNDFGMSLNVNGRILAGTGNPDITIASTIGFNDGQPHLVTFTRTRNTGALELHVDGVSQGRETGGKQSLVTPARLVLGAQQTLINWLSGDIAEVRIFSAALTPAERGAEENALKCKYGRQRHAAACSREFVRHGQQPEGAEGTGSPAAGATGYTVKWSDSVVGPFTTLVTNQFVNAFLHITAIAGATNYYQVTASSPCGTSAGVAVTTVFLPLPALEVGSSSAGLTLQWPAWADDWSLLGTTNLTPPAFWMPVTNAGQFQRRAERNLAAERQDNFSVSAARNKIHRVIDGGAASDALPHLGIGFRAHLEDECSACRDVGAWLNHGLFHGLPQRGGLM